MNTINEKNMDTINEKNMDTVNENSLGIKRLGDLIYTNNWEYKIYAVEMCDTSSSRVSYEMYVVSRDGEMSDLVTITRKDFYRKKSCFDVFLDLEGGFTRDDLDAIRNKFLDFLNEKHTIELTQGRATLEEMHLALSRYIRENAEDLSDNPDAGMFIKDKYGYMLTPHMDAFVKIHKELGYKRIEILKRLKIMRCLENGKNRPYDTLVSVKGTKKHFYKIILAEEPDTDREECEVVA